MRRLILAILAASCAWAAPLRAQDLPTLRMGLDSDADMLDPTLARTYIGRIVFAGLCDKLFDIDEKLQIVPQLATAYEWPDSRTLVIHLRAGVAFQDGTAMDATAVKYSLDRHLTMSGSSRRGEIASMDHVDIVDPLTVRVTLKTPASPFVAQLTDRAGMIVSPKAAEAAGKDFALHPVCAGPFSFTERVSQDRIVLDRFPGYWDAARVKLGRIVYRPIPDSSVRLANLQAGALDIIEGVLPSDAETITKNPGLRLMSYAGLGYQSMNLNVGKGPDRWKTPFGQDARVRKAFELSIDREALIQVVYQGLFTPVAQGVPPASPFYASAVPPPLRDVAKAKALLKAAGVALPVVVELTVANSPDQKQTGEVIQSMAAEAGFDVKIRSMEFASSLDAADRGDFQAYLIGWSGRADPDANLWNFIHTDAPLNYPGYANKDVDGWLEQARVAADVPTRAALYAKVAAKTEEDLPLIYMYIPKFLVGATSRLSGFVPVPDGLIRPQGLVLAK